MRVRDAAIRGNIHWPGAGYFGDRPTFNTNRTFLEVFLIGFEGDLYGRTLMVELVELIRPDRRFDSIGELVSQMRQDCDAASARLDALDRDNPLTAYPLGLLQQQGLI